MYLLRHHAAGIGRTKPASPDAMCDTLGQALKEAEMRRRLPELAIPSVMTVHRMEDGKELRRWVWEPVTGWRAEAC